jgi:hypothetical protein
MELKIAIELNGDLEDVDWESRNVRRWTTAKAGTAGYIGGSGTSDTFAVESAASQGVTLGIPIKGICASESIEIETSIAGEGASGEGTPIKTRRLLGVTIIVCVGGALERRGIRPTSSRYARCQGNDGGKCGLHGEDDG